MRALLFAKRCTKEVVRDPINLFFGLVFPLVLLGLLSIINASIPAEANNTMFAIRNLAPGIAMFGTAFLALFSGMLLAKDRTSSFLMRLFTSPMTARDFIIGYTIPMIIIATMQAVITLVIACFIGLDFSVHIIGAIVITTVTSLLFVGCGLFFGSLINERAVGGICGALLTNVAGWLSGVFVPVDLIGGGFKMVAEALPFYHSVAAIKGSTEGNWQVITPHLLIVLCYTTVIFTLAIYIFRRKMTGRNT